ncbi:MULTISPECIES: YbaY family lipoprotein [Providencia]|uniref:YbaY family lipoprotein n=1 Tax=Providencia rettgeri TaxID=587 RepID=A0A3R8VXY7_PRORE|nr:MULTISPECIES: YbaY family lipoprotein [Providencia]ELR5075409.1 YbaY family lipoprotein [Providencia stuartii]ELR5069039.1 YbaY family lipoprotein [Providencia rettgeri]ELR5219132.1 YbaY family lipoprotein [Providencia rettgeri]ELR5221254.1 YbaY family lipoprotein [Providencia rettgeri]MBV2188111.1 YbaY family lipoprotein [Providencia rettgeri]
MKFFRYIVSLLVLLMLVGCEGNSTKPNEKALNAKNSNNNQTVDSGKIEGRVVILQNTALPEGAVVTITLADTTVADLPALILSQKYYNSVNNRPTIPFELTYQKNEVRQEGRLVVNATVNANGKLLYISDGVAEVINNGITTNVELLMVSAN